MKLVRLFLVLGAWAMLIVPAALFAQTFSLIDPGACDPALPPEAGGCGFPEALDVFRRVIRWLNIVVMPLATILILWGGGVILTAGGNKNRVLKGRDMIVKALIGVGITLGAWLVVQALYRILPVLQGYIPQ